MHPMCVSGSEAGGESVQAGERHPGGERERLSADSAPAGLRQHRQHRHQPEQHWTHTGETDVGNQKEIWSILLPIHETPALIIPLCDFVMICLACVVRTCTSAVRKWDRHCSDWPVTRRIVMMLWVRVHFINLSLNTMPLRREVMINFFFALCVVFLSWI